MNRALVITSTGIVAAFAGVATVLIVATPTTKQPPVRMIQQQPAATGVSAPSSSVSTSASASPTVTPTTAAVTPSSAVPSSSTASTPDPAPVSSSSSDAQPGPVAATTGPDGVLRPPASLPPQSPETTAPYCVPEALPHGGSTCVAHP